MKRRSLCTGGLVFLLGGASWQGGAAEPRGTHATPVPAAARTTPASTTMATAKFQPIRQFQGNLSLDRAVEIALQQNPDILNALQDIQRTRGLIIEIRASALPHIVASGDYLQQDRQLLRGGGFTGGATSINNASLASTALASTQPTTTQTTSGFVGNTNTAGTGIVSSGVGGIGASGSGTGLNAARAPRHPTATAVDGSGTGTGTQNSGDSGDVLAQIQQAIASSNQDQILQDKSWNITIEARQALYTGGQLSSAIRVAKLQQDTAFFRLRDTVDRIIAQVREQFYTVLLNRQLINVAEEAVRLAQEQLTDQQNRYEAGTVPKFNVLRAEVEVANAQPVLIRSRSDYLLAQIQLAKALGLSPGANGKPEFNCVGDLAVSRRRISLPDSLELARARRPYLKIQRQSILIDVEGVKIEMAGYKPRLDAHGGYEFRNRSQSDDLSDVANGWFFGVTGSWNIFDGFETYGRVKQARARLEQAKIIYDDSVREVDLEVQSAYANLEQARQTIESQQKNVESAAEALRLARERFSAGAGTQLEVLDARVALTRARTTELQARSDFNRDLAEFDRATATETRYHEYFQDPMLKVERGILARIAESVLPKPPVMTPEASAPGAPESH